MLIPVSQVVSVCKANFDFFKQICKSNSQSPSHPSKLWPLKVFGSLCSHNVVHQVLASLCGLWIGMLVIDFVYQTLCCCHQLKRDLRLIMKRFLMLIMQ